MNHPGDLQLLDDILRFSPDVICAVDAGGQVRRVSAACLPVLGYAPADLLGQPWAALVYPDDLVAVAEVLGAALAEPLHFTCRCLTKAGQPMLMHWTVPGTTATAARLFFGHAVADQPALPTTSQPLQPQPGASRFRAGATHYGQAYELRRSEQRFRLLFENNMSFSAFQDSEGRTLDINPAFLAFLKRTKDEVLQQQLTDFLPLAFRTQFQEKFQQAIGGQTVHYEAVAPDAEGRLLTLNVTKMPLVVAERIIGVHVAALDTTAFSAAQEEMAILAEQHLTLLESISGTFLSFDREWHLLYINREGEQLLGLDRAACLGENIWSLLPPDTNSRYRQLGDEVLATGQSTHFETYADRLARWLEVKVMPSPDGLLVYILDITDQVEDARQLRLLALVAEGTDSGVLITDAACRVEWVNVAFTRQLGYTLDDMRGQYPGDVLNGPGTTPAARQLIREGLQRQEPFSATLLHYAKDGHQAWMALEVTPIFNPEGSLTQFVILLQDITARKETEAQQAKMTQDLFEHNRDLQQFTYIVSHNLRAPLANALGLATLLTKQDRQSAGFDTLLQHLRQSMTQADGVLKDLNLMLSIRDKPAAQEPVPLAEVCALVVQAQTDPLAACGGQVRLEVAADLWVRGSRAYLYSIFDNLLSNAIKYRAAQRPLEVTITAVRAHEGDLRISVTDNGSGFDTDKAGANIFQLYKRFHTRQSGRGIGLFLVKAHIEAMNGQIAVQSAVDAGTSFLLQLPLA